MAGTMAGDLLNSAVTNYSKEYMRLAAMPENTVIHAQFVDWKEVIPDRGGFGGTFDWPVFGKLDPQTNQLSEGVDLVPKKFGDYNITLSPAEYGDAIGWSNLAQFKSRVDLQTQAAEMVTISRVQSQDMIIRKSIYGHGSSRPSQTIHIDGSAAMANLTGAGSGDQPTWAFFTELAAQARARGIVPRDGQNFVTIVHPLLSYELKQLNEFKYVGYYQQPDRITYAGEVGLFGGFRIIESVNAKIFWGAGTVAQTKSYLDQALNPGDTKVYIHELTGIAVGDYITIGTVETESVAPATNLEQVYVTAVSAASGAGYATVVGVGNGTNMGVRYAHAASEDVVEAYNVAGIPVIGKNSLIGCHASSTGRNGVAKFRNDLDLFNRQYVTGWYWYGGVTRVERNLMLGKVALSKGTIGSD